MLFMSIFTWEPEQDDAVRESFKKIVAKRTSEGTKATEWMDIGGRRVFGVFEATDPKAILSIGSAGHGKWELIPVMEGEEAWKLLLEG